ncbi:MAG: homocysteine S-methyltransferase family protein [Planctomycetes bacterium]|nr:homocysteine S-methyltransferase family protein [Planctomycetota bacterium]MBU1517350.1 homocysteine S-methyltransferase family protein [Planctomycetota bacterium]
MMAKKNLKEKITDGLLILDGAMGTQLMARGVEAGICNEMLNIESPEIILDIHRSYFNAGSEAVYTNTFGANEVSLGRHGLAEKAEQINTAAVKIAKQAVANDGYVIGDIGPSGEFLKPLGMLEPERLKSVYVKQAKALCEAGVDGFIVETFMAVDEAKVAAEAVKSVCDLPVFATLAFDAAGNDFKTMMGVSVERVVDEFSALGVDGLGFNCGTLKMEQYFKLAEKFAKLLAGKNIALIAKPNGGKPELVDGQAVYKLSDEDFGDWMEKIHKAGAAIIGGCCGTTPGHIKAMTKKLKS